jgi:arylsulfatase A-like enzyme
MSRPSISRRSLLGGATFSVAASALHAVPAAADEKVQRKKGPPNIVFILADDLGWADLSSYGRRDYRTPVLDALAQHGIRLTQAYANSSICTPTRVAFLTGRYQQRLPVGLQEPLDWVGGAPPGTLPGIPPEHPTIASLLKDAGYRTALVGKWHAGYLPQYSPNKSGFEEFFGIFSGGVDYFTHRDGNGAPDLWEDETPVEKTGYITDLITGRAVDYIRRKAAQRQPFYLSVHYTAPHWPWEGPGDEAVSRNITSLFHLDGGSPKVYGEIVKRLDSGIGRILERAGRHHVRLDGDAARGRRCAPEPCLPPRWHRPAAAPPGHGHRASTPAPALLAHRGQRALRDGDLKYVRLAREAQVVTQGGLPAALLGTEFLFDVTEKPRERANLLAARPEDAARLKAAWEAWNATVLPELPPRGHALPRPAPRAATSG